MSSEYSPYINMDFNQSLFNGDNFGGLYQLLPLLFKQLAGYPVHFPGTIPEAGYYNFYDNYRAMLATSDNARSFDQTKQLDAVAQEETISIIAQRMAATFGFPLTDKQMAAVRKAAGLLAIYGPQFMSVAQQVLQSEGLEKDGSEQQIINALATANNLLDATYGPAGSRLPFYSAAKQAISHVVPLREQNAVLEEAVHRLFPLDSDTQAMGGLTATETASLLPNMIRMGVNPLNTQTREVQTLIQEQAAQGWQGLSAPEQKRMLEARAEQTFAEVRDKSNLANTKRRWAAQEVQRLGEERKKPGNEKRSEISMEDMAQYVNLREQLPSIGRRLQSSKFFDKNKDIRTATLDELEQSLAGMNQELAANEQALPTLAEDSEQRRQLEARQRTLTALRNDLQKHVNVYTKYQEAGGDITRDPTQTLIAEQAAEYANVLRENLKEHNIQMSDQEAEWIKNATILRSNLSRYSDLNLSLLESTEEEKQEERQKYIEQLRNDYKGQEVLQQIEQYAGTVDMTGLSLGQHYQAVTQSYLNQLQEGSSAETQQILAEYGQVLQTGDQKRIEDFRRDHREVTSRFDAIIGSRKTEELLGAEARSASRLFNAIAGTGGGAIGGKPIQGINQVPQVMDMITQMVGRGQFNAANWEDYWASIAYGMNQTGTSLDEVMQMSKLGADAASYVGGNRGLAAMAATEMGLGAKSVAAEMGLNPSMATTLISQAAGVASNSATSRMVNALAGAILQKDVSSFSGLDKKEVDILGKIQRREQLTGEELRYLNDNGQEMLSRMGISPSEQYQLMNETLWGERGEYAIQSGALYELDSSQAESIRKTVIGQYLNSKASAVKDQGKLIELMYSTMAGDLRLRDDPAQYKAKLKQAMEAEGFSEEDIQAIDRLDNNALAQTAFQAIDSTAQTFTNGDLQAAVTNYFLAKDFNIDEAKSAALLAKDLPFKQGTSIQAVMKALRDPGSNLAAVVSAGLSGHYIKDQIDPISSTVATLGILLNDNSVVRNETTSTGDARKAQTALQEIIKKANGNADVVGRALKAHEDVVAKLPSGYTLSALPAEYKDLSDEQKEALREAGISEEEYAAAKQFEALSADVENTETLRTVYANTRADVKQRINESADNFSPTTENLYNPGAEVTTRPTLTAPASASTTPAAEGTTPTLPQNLTIENTTSPDVVGMPNLSVTPEGEQQITLTGTSEAAVSIPATNFTTTGATGVVPTVSLTTPVRTSSEPTTELVAPAGDVSAVQQPIRVFVTNLPGEAPGALPITNSTD